MRWGLLSLAVPLFQLYPHLVVSIPWCFHGHFKMPQTSRHATNNSAAAMLVPDQASSSAPSPVTTSSTCTAPTFTSPSITLSQQDLTQAFSQALGELRRELCSHPDQAQVDFVISGLSQGFRLGFNSLAVPLQSASHNMPSASLQPSVIDQYLLRELEKGCIAGPFLISPIPHLHVSRFGIISKKYQPGKWRLILDLSNPSGHSVNDGIPKDPYSVHYM